MLAEKSNIYNEGCTNTRHEIAMATRFCEVAHKLCWSSVLKLFHVASLAPRILSRIVGFCKPCAPMIYIPLSLTPYL